MRFPCSFGAQMRIAQGSRAISYGDCVPLPGSQECAKNPHFKRIVRQYYNASFRPRIITKSAVPGWIAASGKLFTAVTPSLCSK